MARHSLEYLDELPRSLDDLGLVMDVDLRPCQFPLAPPVIEWLEAELWEDVVDMFEATEATLGMETESLMRLRDQPTMPQQERDMWRARLASSTARQRSRSRSRARGSTEGTGQKWST